MSYEVSFGFGSRRLSLRDPVENFVDRDEAVPERKLLEKENLAAIKRFDGSDAG